MRIESTGMHTIHTRGCGEATHRVASPIIMFILHSSGFHTLQASIQCTLKYPSSCS